MTPVQIEQRKRLISRMAGNIASGLVQANLFQGPPDLKELNQAIATASVGIASAIVEEVDKQFLIQQTAEMGEKPFGETPWGG